MVTIDLAVERSLFGFGLYTKQATYYMMTNQQDLDMLDEYNFSQGIRGKYAQRYSESSNIVKLDDDVAEIFPDERSVNDALRALAKIIRSHQHSA